MASGYENDISADLAVRAHSGTSFSPEKRGASARAEYAAHMQNVEADLLADATTDEQRDEIAAQLERYRAGYSKRFNAWLGAKSRCISSMITGPSNFPVGRAEKANRSEQSHYEELNKYSVRALRAIRRTVWPHRFGISADQPEAIALLERKIADAERTQDGYKQANKIARNAKLSEDEKRGALRDLGFNDRAVQVMLHPQYSYERPGIPPYRLSNNNANIRRMRERIAELQHERAKPAASASTFEGGRIEEHKGDNRLRIYFDAKPAEQLREKLKAYGFKWSPNAGAWQRMLNENARYAAREVLGLND